MVSYNSSVIVVHITISKKIKHYLEMPRIDTRTFILI